MRAITLSRAVAMLATLALTGACADSFGPPPDNPTAGSTLALSVTVRSGQVLSASATVIDDGAAQQEFSRQYLELQEQMQRENRQVTAVSNIMKTKQDAAKNSISNVR